jgi:pleckstrin homology domain-containing family A member 1/2
MSLVQDTKPHRQFALTEVIDALEYTEPTRSASGGNPASAPSNDGLDNQGKHTFKVVTTKRTLMLCAPTEEDEIKWLGSIRALIARRANPPLSSSSIGATQSESTSGGMSGGSGSGVILTKGRRLSSVSASGPAKPVEDER